MRLLPGAAAFVFGFVSFCSAEPTAADILTKTAEAIREGRHDDVRRLVEPALREHPDWRDGHLHLALSHYRRKHWTPADRHFGEVLRIDPDFHRARLLSGWCRYYLGELSAARERLERYRTTDPDSWEAALALGLVEFDEDRIDVARALLTRALALAGKESSRTRALIRTRLADVLLRGGEPEKAREHLLAAVSLDPDAAKAFFKLSRVLALLGDHEGSSRAADRHAALVSDEEP